MDKAMKNKIKRELLVPALKLKPFVQPDHDFYFRALEGISRKLPDLSVIDYECIMPFFSSLVDNLRELISDYECILHSSYSLDGLESVAADQFQVLHQELNSLRFYLMILPVHDSDERLYNFMFKIQELTIQAGCLLCSCIFRQEINQFTFLESEGGLLEKEVEHVKSECNHLIIPKAWQLNFPKTNEVGYIDFIIMNLEERLHCKSTPIDRLKSQIVTVYEELVALRDDFGGFLKLQNDNERLKAVFTCYKDVAYQVEYFVDSSPCGVVPFGYQKIGLFNLMEELQHIKKELKDVLNDTINHKINQSLPLISLKANAQNINAALDLESEVKKKRDKDASQLVGFDDEVEKIKDHILGGFKQLTIISIVGMPGLGKTTLANSFFRDPSVAMHFHACAWCSVSQVYNKDMLLLEILHQIQPKTVADHDKKEFDVMLYQSLKGKKYLVIMDDMWDIDAWNDVSPYFPNDSNGSRIIFTTRNQGVAMQANSISHALRLLSDEESLKLLLVKVFEEETLCPPEIFPVARRIVENCKCLPLTVVLTAGLLKTIERTKDSWEQFANVLTSHEVDYPREQYLGILELSYKHLPDYLKPCFLYFGAFPEDAEIPVWKLVRLWIAEGFVQPKLGLNTQEHEAETYINDLIDRSLLMVAKRSYNGGVKTCRIHDLLHDFCINRAKGESFLLKINWCDSFSTLTDSEVHEQFRLAIHSNAGEFPPVKMGFESRVRSLWLLNSGNYAKSTFTYKLGRLYSLPYELNGVEVFFFKLRLLRVLDLQNCQIDDEDFDTITRLVHLRYLSVQATNIPRGIEKLKKLETFLLFNRDYFSVKLPETIWNMVNLRHIQVEGMGATFCSHEFFENCPKLDGLTILSTLVFSCTKKLGKEVEKTLRKMPNLKKLKCEFIDFWHSKANWFAGLDILHQLEDLSISGNKINLHVLFPWSLKKLSLEELSLSWDLISVIGELPNLEVLKLRSTPFEGEEWHMEEGEFQKLKILKLQYFECHRWYASSEHLPCLEKLVLQACDYLEEVPLAFGDIPCLRIIKVDACLNSLVDSARKIEEEQHGMGNDQFNLYISDDHSDA